MQPLFSHPLISVAISSCQWRRQCLNLLGTTVGTFYKVHLTPLDLHVGKKTPPVPFQHFTVKVFCQVHKETGFSFPPSAKAYKGPNYFTTKYSQFPTKKDLGWPSFWAKQGIARPNLGIPKLQWHIDEAVVHLLSQPYLLVPSCNQRWDGTNWHTQFNLGVYHTQNFR